MRLLRSGLRKLVRREVMQALAVHGVPRATGDIDVLMPYSPAIDERLVALDGEDARGLELPLERRRLCGRQLRILFAPQNERWHRDCREFFPRFRR